MGYAYLVFDQLFTAIYDVIVAVLVPSCDVTRLEPFIMGDRVFRHVWAVQITLKQNRCHSDARLGNERTFITLGPRSHNSPGCPSSTSIASSPSPSTTSRASRLGSKTPILPVLWAPYSG
jgi:hypothetical protein